MDPWSAYELGTDGLRAQYCELNRLGSWLRQPANSLSNLAFAVAGVAVALDRRPGRLEGPHRPWLAGMLLALAAGSGLFHASITLWAQRVDMGATYGVVLALIAATASVGQDRTRQFVWWGAAVGLTALFVVLDLFRQGTWLLPLLLAIALVGAARVWWRDPAGHCRRHLLAALGGLVVAGTAWFLDLFKVGCQPESWLQWHALWHCATAVAALELYRFLDREEHA